MTSKGSLSWDTIGCKLSPWLRDAIAGQGFDTMTPVQASSIPLFTGNKDVVVEAVTGSGKTVSFVVPVLQRLCNSDITLAKNHFFAMVIAPTRELAVQINEVFNEFLEYYPVDNEEVRKEQGLKYRRIKTQQIVGSLTTIQEDLQKFVELKPQILVGTPGKLLDFLRKKGTVKCKDVDCLVLDEADRLLDVSFENDIREIVRILPRQKRIGLFSATISSAGDMIFKIGMANPVKVTVKNKSSEFNAAPTALSIRYLVIKPELKIKKLLQIFAEEPFKKCIVYLPTCVSVVYFYSMLSHLLTKEASKNSAVAQNLSIFSIHGKLKLKPRIKTLQSFKDSTATKSVLLATDVAARGIDIPDVDLVLQLDPPTDPDVFLHRCGRTGRANKVGKAIVFLNEGREEDYVEFLKVKKVEMEEESAFSVPDSKLDLELNIKYGFKRNIDKLIENWVLQDRARYDSSVRSYVAFIRYYSKHVAGSIFRLDSLDYIGLGKAYGLIRLPKMPEIKHIKDFPEDGWLIPKIDLDNYQYVHEQKEKARLEELANAEKQKQRLKEKLEKKKDNQSWSNKTDAKEVRSQNREKNKRKREIIEAKLKQDAANSSDEEEMIKDWKEEVREKKKQKQSSNLVFDGF